MNIANLKIGTRLGLSFACICLLLLLIVGIGLTRLSLLNASTNNIVHSNWVKASAASEAISVTNNIAIALRNGMLTEDAVDRKKQVDIILAARLDGKAAVDILEKTISTPQERVLYLSIVENRLKYVAGQIELMDLTAANKVEESRTYLSKQLRPVLGAYKAALNDMIKHQAEQMREAGVVAGQTYNGASNLMIGIGVAALVLAGVIGFLITRSITVPIGVAVTVARRVAAGDLTTEVQVRSTDETGQLLQALKDMNESLVKIVGEVRSGTGTIATASSEIAAGNQDLSSRTEEQASSLAETASSMEQMTGTVKQNADNARQANQLAATASEVACKGGAVVEQVVATMSSINESSRKIVDIIGVIDSIAFQTNILALNAAVEAARAGEQGRGFAVVASEVRNLAQRAAAAAKEIKALIGDSVAKVDVGSKLVEQAGVTMHEIVNSVKRVTDIMGDITSASQEQTTGIEQINRAISQMDEVTQQNAALVEEAAAAAESLQDQAHMLAQAVSVFKLGSDGRTGSTVASVTALSGKTRRPAPRGAVRPMRLAVAAGARD